MDNPVFPAPFIEETAALLKTSQPLKRNFVTCHNMEELGGHYIK
jgi:hypothetical protein